MGYFVWEVLTKHQTAVYSLYGACTTSVALLLKRKLGYVCFCFSAKITFNLHAGIKCIHMCKAVYFTMTVIVTVLLLSQ